MVTLKDIALAAGVSPSTVSAILNETPRSTAYAEATRTRVREAAKQLGYSPNVLARTLKKQNSRLLGVLMFGQDFMYYGRALMGAEEMAHTAGYEIVTASMGYSLKRFHERLRMLAAWRIEGVMLMMGGNTLTTDMLAGLKDLHIPFVSGGAIQPETPSTCIHFNTEAGHTAAKWLLEKGHRRIGVLGTNVNNPQSMDRLRGIESAAREYGLSLEPQRIIPANPALVGVSAGYTYAEILLKQARDTTAILAINDIVAIGAMRKMTEAGIAIPDDISCIGFDDLCLDNTENENNRLGLYLSPTLTTVRIPLREMGSAMARLLTDIIEKRWCDETPYSMEFLPRLIVRNSAKGIPA